MRNRTCICSEQISTLEAEVVYESLQRHRCQRRYVSKLRLMVPREPVGQRAYDLLRTALARTRL